MIGTELRHIFQSRVAINLIKIKNGRYNYDIKKTPSELTPLFKENLF